MRGRRPRPTHLKLIEGNPGKRRINRREPQPVAALPEPPAFMNAEAVIEWNTIAPQLLRLGLLTQLDRMALAAYCTATARWSQAETALARMAEQDGVAGALLVKSRKGNVIENPLVVVSRKAAADMLRFAVEFGMTPSARSRIEAGPTPGAGKFAGLLGGDLDDSF